MYTIILVNGNPCTGKTTATRDIASYLEKNNRTVTTVLRNSAGFDANMNVIQLSLYKWIKERDTEFLVIDSPAYSVFERADILDTLSAELDATGISADDLVVVSVNMSRPIAFCYQHNDDKDHRPYTKRSMLELLHAYQQPITAEGFDVIYRVTGNDHINPAHMFRVIENATKRDYEGLAMPDTKAEAAVKADDTAETAE